ncbi:putative MFS family arabinose efflux permease [Actinocorallia herbida]|uniref:Putative MFS family arabinose efflux permease n=1 Tax=Actinocorallia herbida TaxID=58109 RepID=A0A3N1CWA4_9ACTN|nr:MFS transporter [Actinocorallia herbida]ROO85544.1 putative MFS family arabinose efflux permease [Actinocorallia herbida]
MTRQAKRSFSRSARLLMVNQFGINLGFYLLMPFLADHLSEGLGLTGALVGIVLGVRNLSQQGMFLVGGTLADRFGPKPLIVAGCLLRTGGFALLGLVDTLPGLVLGAAATGLAGALFNPAVRAYLAAEAGARRVEAFAAFNAFYQAGILAGPVVGLALTAVGFRTTCLTAAAVFAVLTVAQLTALPHRPPTPSGRLPVRTTWRQVLGDRRFLAFSAAMCGTYLLSFQTYLALPLALRALDPGGGRAAVAVTAMFAAGGLLTVLAQTRLTAWCARRWSPGRALVRGNALLSAAFLLPALTGAAVPARPSLAGFAVAAAPLLATGVLIACATMITFPFEMDVIVTLSGDRLVATHYGLYNTIAGVGIALGNLGAGAALDLARRLGAPALPWLALAAVGATTTAVLHRLGSTGRLTAGHPAPIEANAP